MRNVSRQDGKSEPDKTIREQRHNALLTRCEARGREVYTQGGQYLGLAETPERAELWGQSGQLLKLAKQAADGKPPSQEQWNSLVGQILKAR